MTFYGALVFFGLSFFSFSCEGKINTVPGGNRSIVLPGSTVSINWTFTDDPAKSTLEWYFKPSDGSSQQHVATKFPGGKAQIESSSLSRVSIEDPATLVLTNVDQNHNGTYILVLKVIGVVNSQISEVVVLIAQKPTAKLNCSTTVNLNQESYFACLCRGENGNPPAVVTWYDKDGNRLGLGNDEQAVLTLKNVTRKDSGTYECVTQSYTLSNNKTIEIIVTLNFGSNDDEGGDDGLSGGAIAGIVIAVLVFIVIVAFLVYFFCCKSEGKSGYRGNPNVRSGGMGESHYELGENARGSQGDNEYETAVSSRNERARGKRIPETLPPVYAQVDKENREGKPLYASLDTNALNAPSDGSKNRPDDRHTPTQYAAIDHTRTAEAPKAKADLV